MGSNGKYQILFSLHIILDINVCKLSDQTIRTIAFEYCLHSTQQYSQSSMYRRARLFVPIEWNIISACDRIPTETVLKQKLANYVAGDKVKTSNRKK